ncbi:diphthamide biosynthesis protein [Methanothermus fervidus DSM 2088]|uniref:2-(3-amino-3-carboxypropyl)histidine synthase n=1 Tax=Methanothermus fervidus (strain ATCC 43054 / DSM 2088 / JCM 10308 / V24 S) TaxID=523846 RepID=E3GW43_METFV|nr:diphthamide biosynthesis enzyme Dph2 [Methanothermus fervidus]ADP77808.1 diphthamide biosynthesis protein [Methanothermus fervidus DSM 2088]
MKYDFKLNKVIKKIKEKNAKNVVLQFPEGLRPKAIDIAKKIESKTNVNVIISADSCYGACDVADKKYYGIVDLIVHYGHTPLPIKTKVPTIFVEAFSTLDFKDIKNLLKQAIDYIGKDKKIGLVSVAQHLPLLKKIKKYLEKKGKEVVMKKGIGTKPGQVLGCNFSSVKNLDVDTYLFIGGGNFHALGIKLATKKPVVIVDPYEGEVRNIERFAKKIMKIRFAKIIKAQKAKTWGILMSSKPGQLRQELALKLKNKLKAHGKKSFLIILDNIVPEFLQSFTGIDAFVSTACPRIAIDDSYLFKKPVLTPKELEIVLGERSWEEYELDEIIWEEGNEN